MQKYHCVLAALSTVFVKMFFSIDALQLTFDENHQVKIKKIQSNFINKKILNLQNHLKI